jgi:hypothetical protein
MKDRTMKMSSRRMIAWLAWVPIASMLALPGGALAETAPALRVEQTPHYVLELTIGPAEQMISPMDAMTAETGEVMVSGGSMSTSPSMDTGMGMDTPAPNMDQGRPVNHHLEVHITHSDTGGVVNDVTPVIRITDKSTGESRDLPQVMGMLGVGADASDFHYGQNVYMSGGVYTVAVMVGPDKAVFRDVQVKEDESPGMSDSGSDNVDPMGGG